MIHCILTRETSFSFATTLTLSLLSTLSSPSPNLQSPFQAQWSHNPAGSSPTLSSALGQPVTPLPLVHLRLPLMRWEGLSTSSSAAHTPITLSSSPPCFTFDSLPTHLPIQIHKVEPSYGQLFTYLALHPRATNPPAAPHLSTAPFDEMERAVNLRNYKISSNNLCAFTGKEQFSSTLHRAHVSSPSFRAKYLRGRLWLTTVGLVSLVGAETNTCKAIQSVLHQAHVVPHSEAQFLRGKLWLTTVGLVSLVDTEADIWKATSQNLVRVTCNIQWPH